MRSGANAGSDQTVYVENASDRPIRLMALVAEGRPVKDIIADLQRSGSDQQQLIAALTKMNVLDPLLHEGFLDRSFDPDWPIDELKSGARRSFTIKYGDFPPICYRIDFSFIDANGRYWRKYLDTGRMLSADDLERNWLPKRLRRGMNKLLGTRL